MRIAQAFVRANARPKRSILFMVYDGEERIFLGSYYYMTHPLEPLSGTVANFNMDMIGRDENDANWPVPPGGNANMVNVLGTRYNPALSDIIDKANSSQHLKLDHKMDTVDPDSLWSRSDHFWMATLHIPQVEFQTGLHPDYHTDNDTWQRINYDKLTRIARLVYVSVEDVANASERVAFVPAGAAAK
jgi:Zn-dependent M28 family amino/carboxypeptidase